MSFILRPLPRLGPRSVLDNGRRFARGLPALVCWTALAFALAPGWLMSSDPKRRKRLEDRFFARLLRACGVAAADTPVETVAPGTLFLANHVSFTDVFALALVLDARFVAKADVERWPWIGSLAKRYGTIFVDRRRASSAKDQVEEIARRLRRGENVILFPEGTTSHGHAVLPFRSALLAAAGQASEVRPVAIGYMGGPPRGYVGDESLFANLIRLAPHRTKLTIGILPKLPRALHCDRKALAVRCQGEIAALLACRENHAGGIGDSERSRVAVTTG